MIDNTVL